MKILDLDRSEVKRLIDEGWLNKKALNHYDVCKALAQGKTANKVAEEFNYNLDVHVRWIKKTKCPECGKH